MKPQQTLEVIELASLLERVRAMRVRDRRLVQISATALADQFELTYSFDFDDRLASLRVMVPRENARVPSIQAIYDCAFLYENEMHDLFNITVEGMKLQIPQIRSAT